MKTKQNNNNNNNQASLLTSTGNIQTVRGLFSEHFFEYTIRQNDDYRKIGDLKKVREEIGELFREHRDHLDRSKSEEDCKQNLIEPILEKLGFGYSREGRIGELKPDYLLFSSDETRKQIQQSAEDHLARYHHAIGLLEAKPFGFPLGNPLKDGTKCKFPHDQIRDYLNRAYDSKEGSWFKWGILTNGKHWRLYYQKINPDRYFEIDLEQAVANERAFRTFWFLFHVSAFVQNSDQICRLDNSKADASQYGTHVEENLKGRIFDILIELANGFYNNPENKITDSEEDMRLLYDISLIFLYRVLFILYAEGRNLLPVKGYGGSESPNYRKFYSLAYLSDELKEGILPKHDVIYHNRIKRLFKLIEGKKQNLNQELNVPQYDGGLFDNILRLEISDWVIEDGYLIKVLRGLIFIEAPSPKGKTRSILDNIPIDYSALEIRQLGSIYEGLLEHSLKYDSEQNCVILKRDNIKRKSTGSYYTPDLIVQYIVEETFTPHLTKISKMPCVVNGEPNSYATEVLKLKVLDPAMGSGHFLVRATEFLADKIIDDPTTEANIDHEEQKAIWLRRVVESCIYGVDLNPLAVELAKLSLWLTCISSDKPLNFLDHHLRCGNSLVGTKNEEMGILARKGETIHVLSKIEGLGEKLAKAKDALREITAGDVTNLRDAEKKKQIWDEDVYKLLAPFRAIADLRTSMEFGLNLHPDEYKEIVLALMSAEPEDNANVSLPVKLQKKYNDAWKTHLANVELYKPFHWELEFPDVFIKDGDEKGFDVVIGNPPYLNIDDTWGKGDKQRVAFKTIYSDIYNDKTDIVFYFMAKAVTLTKGKVGYIVSRAFLEAHKADKLRQFLSSHTSIEHVIDFRNCYVFPKEGITTCIIVLGLPDKANNTLVHSFLHKALAKQRLADQLTDPSKFEINKVSQVKLSAAPWHLNSDRTSNLYAKIDIVGQNLGEILIIGQGMQTGRNHVFCGHSVKNAKIWDPESNIMIKRATNSDIQRYFIIDRSEYMIYPNGVNSFDDLPKLIQNYLEKHALSLKERAAFLRGNCEWWQFTWPLHKEYYSRKRLISPYLATNNRFAIDINSEYIGLTDTIVLFENDQKEDLFYLLGLLNSTLLTFRFKGIAKLKGAGIYEYFENSVSKLPIYRIDFKENTQKVIHDNIVSLVDQTISLHIKLIDAVMSNEKDELQENIEVIDHKIDALVYQLYGLTEEEIAIVEGQSKGD